MEDLCAAVESGAIAEVGDFQAALLAIRAGYEADEWAWVKAAATEALGLDVEKAGKDELLGVAEKHLETRRKFLKLVVADAQKEFDELSHTGFGQDGSREDREADFVAVRGVYGENKFVKEMQERLVALEGGVADFREALAKL